MENNKKGQSQFPRVTTHHFLNSHFPLFFLFLFSYFQFFIFCFLFFCPLSISFFTYFDIPAPADHCHYSTFPPPTCLSLVYLLPPFSNLSLRLSLLPIAFSHRPPMTPPSLQSKLLSPSPPTNATRRRVPSTPVPRNYLLSFAKWRLCDAWRLPLTRSTRPN